MPGIPFHRFVEPTELRVDFTCTLCHLVLAHPLMASCCKTVFCDACIRPYVQSKKSCPADKKPLTVDCSPFGPSNGGGGSLVRPSSSLLRQLSCLKVKCTYGDVGCQEVLPLETMIEVHEKDCPFGQAQICPHCSFAIIEKMPMTLNDDQQQQQQEQQMLQQQQEQTDHQQDQVGQQLEQQQEQAQPPPSPPPPQSVHVCQQSVAEYRESTGKELEEARSLLASLRLQLANYNRTVHELKLERSRALREAYLSENAKPTVMNIDRVVSNKELLIEARKYVNSAQTDGQKTSKEMVAKVVGLVKEALITRGDNIHAVARFIKEAMDSHYVGDWNVNLLWNNLGFAYHNFCPENYVEIKFGRVSIVVYKSFKSLGFNRVVNLYRAGALQDFDISKSGFDDATTKVIKKVVENALKTATDAVDFTEKVTSELMRKFGGIFHCLIYKVNFGFYCIRSENSHFCLMTNSEAKILIFK